MAWSVGVDVGGTFTDFYARNGATGEVRMAKRPSTPDDPARAILEGLADLAAGQGVALDAVDRLSHGTTIATNALIQRRGGKVALITTGGFRDLLEIGRQTRPHMYDLQKDHPPPLVPRERRWEIDERITADGAVHRELTADALADAVATIRAAWAKDGIEACAICFLFAFINPAHEQRVAAALRAALPELHLSLSSEVQPEFREYERFSTTVLNAYLQPVMTDYVGRLEAELATVAPNASVGINQSSGGLMSPDRARAFPVRTALSGPAAGVVGALHAARAAGRDDVITLDMGGTSADVSLIRALRAELSFNRAVAGFPIRLPMVDINTVGAGGGSIAWFDRDGLLKVGPASAGADPGPACYGRGGTQPTVSDANLLLGRLTDRGLLGGDMALDRGRARAVFEPLADRLEMTVERTAHGVLGIVVANMVRAIRTISVERGHDPRQFALMAFGGAGPLHARDVARALGIGTVVVPAAPGIVCAEGLVVSDLKEDFVASQRTRVEPATRATMAERVAELLGRADDWFAQEAVPAERRLLDLSFDMRYVGQNFELSVPISTLARLDGAAVPDAAALRQRFFSVHETAYGYFNPDDAVEVVAYRLVARGNPAPADAPVAPAAGGAEPKPRDSQPVYFGADAPVATPVFERADFRSGLALAGPAVIEQLDATTLIYPGDRATVDRAGNLMIELET